jgi:hypothetical protein
MTSVAEPDLVELFCDVDDFCQQFWPAWQQHQLSAGERQRLRTSCMTPSEIMTLLIHFHQSHYRHFKGFYLYHVHKHLGGAFRHLVSYTRFVALMPSVLIPLTVYLHTRRRGEATGIGFIDSTPLVVCHNRRIRSHKVFKQVARRGKTSTGWFYGFKLHLVVNDRGELLAFQLTPGNVDDRQPVPQLVRGLSGKLFGDKGYLSQKLFTTLLEQNLQLVTKLRRNMKNKLMPLIDKLLLRKRAIIETINDQLKNISQIEHTRHRSVANFLVNLLAGLAAYTHRPTKPSIYEAKRLLETQPITG